MISKIPSHTKSAWNGGFFRITLPVLNTFVMVSNTSAETLSLKINMVKPIKQKTSTRTSSMGVGLMPIFSLQNCFNKTCFALLVETPFWSKIAPLSLIIHLPCLSNILWFRWPMSSPILQLPSVQPWWNAFRPHPGRMDCLCMFVYACPWNACLYRSYVFVFWPSERKDCGWLGVENGEEDDLLIHHFGVQLFLKMLESWNLQESPLWL